ncbi:Adenine deaminase (EC [Olavius algarvensis associated proteobacterium Delta 3]|nr:Adenine deaminase (EC [Olavius algarvensis associated proteobacterium Delta 3]
MTIPLAASRNSRQLIDVALGREKSDLAVVNAALVNVYTGEILDKTAIAVKGKHIAYVGHDVEDMIGPDTEVIDAAGKPVIPGLIDGHTHLVWLYSIPEFLKYAVPGGTTTIISETMEAYPVAGLAGVQDVLASFRNQPIKIFGTAPAMVSTSRATSGIVGSDLERILGEDDVVGLGESYWQAVLEHPDTYLPEYAETLIHGKTLEGHSAGARDRKLNAYVACGISSCHEPITAEDVLERIRLGVHVMIREGSIRRDLEAIAKIREYGVDSRYCILASDGVDPTDLMDRGYMEYILKKAVDSGFSAVEAVRMTTLNVAEHFGLAHLVGGVAPGRFADFLILPDLETFAPELVVSNGTVVAKKGSLLADARAHRYRKRHYETIRIHQQIEPAWFRIPCGGCGGSARVRVIDMVTDLVSREVQLEMPVRDGLIQPDPKKDLLKVAAVDRTRTPGKRFTGWIRGFGLQRGALAASNAWDTSDIIVVGATDEDMSDAVSRIVELQGGAVFSIAGKVVEEIPMPVFGLVSELPVTEMAARLRRLTEAAAAEGCTMTDPLLSLVALTGAAIPFFRICEEGLVDLKTGETFGLFP